MSFKTLTTLATLSLFVTPSLQDCINEHGRTKCSNIPPLKEGETITYDLYLPKFELDGYTGPLTKAMFQNIPRIEQLSLSFCDITSIEEEVFCSLPKLKYIYISDTKLPNITTRTFGTCCHLLHTLGIQKSEIRDIASGSFQYLNQLDTLLIQYSTLVVLKTNVFKGLTSLQHLQLKGNNITAIEEGAFNDLTNLKILNLNDNKLREISLTELGRLTALEDLYLSNNLITDLDIQELLRNLPRLEFLSFYFNKLQCDKLREVSSTLKEKKVGKQVFQTDCMSEPLF